MMYLIVLTSHKNMYQLL